MKFNVMTLMPDMVEGALRYGVVGLAFEKGICVLETFNPRHFASDPHQSVDDRPFGGGDGMWMMAEPLRKALEALKPSGQVFYLSPQGSLFDDDTSSRWAASGGEVTLICGRYGGVDERLLGFYGIQEISLGNFVLSGGEPAAIAMIDSTVRKLPGVLGHIHSSLEDSFAQGFLEMPHFTRPQKWEGRGVPPILLSGDHGKIKQYRYYMGIVTTLMKRPELLKGNLPLEEVKAYVFHLEDLNINPLGWTKSQVLSEMEKFQGVRENG